MCGSCGYNPCQCNNITHPAYNWFNTEHYPCNNCTPSTACKKTFPAACVTYAGRYSTCKTFTQPTNLESIVEYLLLKVCELETQLALCCSGGGGGGTTCPAPQNLTVRSKTAVTSPLTATVTLNNPVSIVIPAGSVIDLIVFESTTNVLLSAGYTTNSTDLNPMDEVFNLIANQNIQLVPYNRYYGVATTLYFSSNGTASIKIYLH